MAGASRMPSDAEFRLLRVLWQSGELSVRELQERVRDDWTVGYTTVLKLLQRMLAKGLVRRRLEGRSHLYTAIPERESLERRMVRDLVGRVFDGSVERLLQRALPREEASREELRKIARLIRELED